MNRLLLPLLLLLSPLTRAGEGPSAAAVDFLEKIAHGPFELESDTALTENTTTEKRDDISARLERLGKSIKIGQFRAIKKRVDGELAGVLVSQVIDFDPNQTTIHAVALLKRNGKWLPAPVLASFENTGITYIPRLSKAAEPIRKWLLDAPGDLLELTRQTIQAELLADIYKAKSPDQLRKESPKTLVNNFISACQSRDLPAALACLGGLEDPLPSFWQDALAFTAAAFRDPSAGPSPWKQLCSPTALHAIVRVENLPEGSIVTLGELDPNSGKHGPTGISLRDFSLDRSPSGLPRLRLPAWLLRDDDGNETKPDPELVKAFPSKLLDKYPTRSFPSPEALMSSFQQALAGPKFVTLLPLIAPPSNRDHASEQLINLAHLWRDFRSGKNRSPLLLDVYQLGDHACALMVRFNALSPSIKSNKIKPLFLVRSADGWNVSPTLSENPTHNSPLNELSKWIKESTALNQIQWLSRIDLPAPIKEIPADSAPTEAEARKAADDWITALQADNPHSVLATAAYFDDESGGQKLLRTIGHELQSDADASILGTHRHGRWAAVTVTYTPSDPDQPPYHLLYPILATAKGPRILAESLLFNANSRPREFLNKAIWTRLADRLPQAAIDELRHIYQDHATLCQP